MSHRLMLQELEADVVRLMSSPDTDNGAWDAVSRLGRFTSLNPSFLDRSTDCLCALLVKLPRDRLWITESLSISPAASLSPGRLSLAVPILQGIFASRSVELYSKNLPACIRETWDVACWWTSQLVDALVSPYLVKQVAGRCFDLTVVKMVLEFAHHHPDFPRAAITAAAFQAWIVDGELRSEYPEESRSQGLHTLPLQIDGLIFALLLLDKTNITFPVSEHRRLAYCLAAILLNRLSPS